MRKFHHGTNDPLGPAKHITGTERQVVPEEINRTGVDAVASVLGLERVDQPAQLTGLPPEEQLAEGLRRLNPSLIASWRPRSTQKGAPRARMWPCA